MDPEQDIYTDPPSMSIAPESNWPDESAPIVTDPSSYLERYKSVIENQPKIQLKRLTAKDLPKKTYKTSKEG